MNIPTHEPHTILYVSVVIALVFLAAIGLHLMLSFLLKGPKKGGYATGGITDEGLKERALMEQMEARCNRLSRTQRETQEQQSVDRLHRTQRETPKVIIWTGRESIPFEPVKNKESVE